MNLPRRKQLERDAFSRTDGAAATAAAGILVLLLLPALATTKQQDKSAVCMSNLHQIWMGMMSYAADNEDTLQNVDGTVPNGGRWTQIPRSTTILPATDHDAYWGIAYFEYIGRSREVFRCSSATIVDEWREDGLTFAHEFWLTSTYGISDYVIHASPSSPVRTISSIINPS